MKRTFRCPFVTKEKPVSAYAFILPFICFLFFLISGKVTDNEAKGSGKGRIKSVRIVQFFKLTIFTLFQKPEGKV